MQKLNPALHIAAFLSAIVPAACVGAPASNSRASELNEARTISRSIDRYASSHPREARYFADIADDRSKGPDRWREFRTLKLIENPDFYDKAIVWTRRGRTAQVNLTDSSPSGDWVRYDNYSFRPDGTLAKVDSTLSTFYTGYTGGNDLIRVLQVRHYNRAGRVLKATKEYRDAKYLRVRPSAYRKNEPLVYLRVSALPFHALLRKPGQKPRR